jgi:hypothetical protein
MNVASAANTVKPNLRRLRTVPFRMSFPCLPPMEPRVDEDSGRKTYQLTMLYPPGTDQHPFREALRQAMVVKFGPERTQWPKVRRTPDDVIVDFEQYNAEAKTPIPGNWKAGSRSAPTRRRATP